MARGNVDALFKKNSKLESFLKRTLPDEAYERVRAYESCIVVSEKENKSFKYCVLDDEYIYLTENPPKNPQDLQAAVSLREIVSVEMVNDFPDFLSGEEREKTQHLQVTYWTTDQFKRRSIRKSRKSPRLGSSSDLHGDRSNASTPMDQYSSQEGSNWSEDYGYMTQSMSSLQVSRPESRGSITSNDGLKSSGRQIRTSNKKKKRMSDSMEDSVLKSLKEEMEEGLLEDIEETDGFLNSTNGRNNKFQAEKDKSVGKSSRKELVDTVSQAGSVRPLPKNQAVPDTTAFEKHAPDDVVTKPNKVDVVASQNGTVDVSEKPTICNCFSLNCFRTSKVSCGRGDDIVDSIPNKPDKLEPLHQNSDKDSSSLFFTKTQQNPEISIDVTSDVASKGNRGSVHSMHEAVNMSRRSSVATVKGQSRAGTPALENEATRSGSNLGIVSVSDFGGSVNGLSLAVESALTERRKTVLNIYLLNLLSPMLMLIRSAWSNYLIRCTLNIDVEMERALKSSVVIRSGQLQREKMESLFNQLKRDLLYPENTMEDTFNLLNELKMATEKNFALKKLFWKNADMFIFLMGQLQRYLPKSPVNINTEHGRIQRADELELVILLVEILSIMFRESEIIPARIQTLKADRGKHVFDLLRVLICSPEVPEKYAAPSRSTHNMQATDEEIQKQVTDFTKVALTAVFEIFLMARQAYWGYSEGSFFNISWVVKVLEEMRTTEKFVEKIISQMMKFIGPTRTDPLTPQESVALYTQFSVLETFLQYSPRVSVFIRSNYLEEFKYFVQVPSVMKKIPPSYPICTICLSLIDSVMNKVLDKPSSAFPKSPR